MFFFTATINQVLREHTPGYWRQRAHERLGNLPKGNQEPFLVKEKVGRPLAM